MLHAALSIAVDQLASLGNFVSYAYPDAGKEKLGIEHSIIQGGMQSVG